MEGEGGASGADRRARRRALQALCKEHGLKAVGTVGSRDVGMAYFTRRLVWDDRVDIGPVPETIGPPGADEFGAANAR